MFSREFYFEFSLWNLIKSLSKVGNLENKYQRITAQIMDIFHSKYIECETDNISVGYKGVSEILL